MDSTARRKLAEGMNRGAAEQQEASRTTGRAAGSCRVEGQAGVPADRRKKYCRYDRYTCRYRKYRGKYKKEQKYSGRYSRYRGEYRKYRRYQEGTKVRKYGLYGLYGLYGKSGKVQCTEKHPAVEQEELEDQLGGTWRPRRGPSLRKRLQKKRSEKYRA